MNTNEEYPFALPPGTVLAGQYVIEQVLGQGGFGITYRAVDHKSGQKVAVKEFFPDTMAARIETTVTAFSGERGESFAYGKGCFLQEAETLAEFIGNKNIVRVHSYFEENGTAYFVMDFVEGISFDRYIKEHGGHVSWEETERILLPVMDALAAVHSRGIIHRDVTPDNIYITGDGTVKLLDFGAARYSLGDKSRSLDVVLKHGFAPKEQYTRHGRQGPYTDVYTVGASFYFAVTGRRPPDSIDRMDEDDLIPQGRLGVSVSQAKEEALLKALNVQPAERFQSMGEFKKALMEAGAEPAEDYAETEIGGGNPGIDRTGTTPAGTNPGQSVPQHFFTAQEQSVQTAGREQTAGQGQTTGQDQTAAQEQTKVQNETVVQPEPSGRISEIASGTGEKRRKSGFCRLESARLRRFCLLSQWRYLQTDGDGRTRLPIMQPPIMTWWRIPISISQPEIQSLSPNRTILGRRMLECRAATLRKKCREQILSENRKKFLDCRRAL